MSVEPMEKPFLQTGRVAAGSAMTTASAKQSQSSSSLSSGMYPAVVVMSTVQPMAMAQPRMHWSNLSERTRILSSFSARSWYSMVTLSGMMLTDSPPCVRMPWERMKRSPE